MNCSVFIHYGCKIIGYEVNGLPWITFELARDNKNADTDSVIEEIFKLIKHLYIRWEKTHILLVEGGLTQEDIRKSVATSAIEFRDGIDELFQILQVKYLHLPLLVNFCV